MTTRIIYWMETDGRYLGYLMPPPIIHSLGHGARHVDERRRAHPAGGLRQSILLCAVPQ